MVDRRDIGSWLEGPGSRTGDPSAYPGERLGMPRSGPGSLGRFGRRLLGVLIDWAACTLIAYVVLDVPFIGAGAEAFWVNAIFAVENLLLVGTLGATLGQRVVGLRVQSTDGRTPRPLQTAVRTLLVSLFIPAMIWDKDGRGLHDKAAGTLIVRG